MRKKVWFGTAGDMRWVPAPLANYQGASVRWREVDQYLNGGAAVRQSVASHQELSLSWAVQSTENLAPVVALLHSPGPFYYVDPIAARANIVPSYWASPEVWLHDGPPLISRVTPTKVAGTSTNGYPATSVKYSVTKATDTNLRIPVPEGHTLHLGVHGTGGTYKLNTRTAKGPLTAASSTRTNLTINGPVIANLKVAAAVSDAVITGIVAQVLPTGETPQPGGFLPGRGTTELALSGDPSITSYSVGIPNAQQGIAADFVEVGAWLQ